MYVCICMAVTEAEVRSCVVHGARTVEKVGEASEAGSGCGSCHRRIEDIIDAVAPGCLDRLQRSA